MLDPHNIGCRQGDVFCKHCIKECFDNEYSNSIQCPKCDQRNMRESKMRSNKFAKRLIDKLLVKCQYCDKNDLKLKNLINHHKICPQRPQKCPYCQINMMPSQIRNHTCDLKIFKTKSLEDFVSPNIYEKDIAKCIKHYFDTHCDGEFMVIVTSGQHDVTYKISYQPEWIRTKKIRGLTIAVYKQPNPTGNNNNKTIGLFIDTKEFIKFCEGLLIGVNNDIFMAKQKLEATFGGNFFIGKGIMGIACKEYTYSCVIINSDELYHIIRISE